MSKNDTRIELLTLKELIKSTLILAFIDCIPKQYLNEKLVLISKYWYMFQFNLYMFQWFFTFKVVGRDSETQL